MHISLAVQTLLNAINFSLHLFLSIAVCITSKQLAGLFISYRWQFHQAVSLSITGYWDDVHSNLVRGAASYFSKGGFSEELVASLTLVMPVLHHQPCCYWILTHCSFTFFLTSSVQLLFSKRPDRPDSKAQLKLHSSCMHKSPTSHIYCQCHFSANYQLMLLLCSYISNPLKIN